MPIRSGKSGEKSTSGVKRCPWLALQRGYFGNRFLVSVYSFRFSDGLETPWNANLLGFWPIRRKSSAD